MVEKSCCFSGDSMYPERSEVKKALKKLLTELIEEKDVTEFYVTDKNLCDDFFISELRKFKKIYKNINIHLVVANVGEAFAYDIERYSEIYDTVTKVNYPSHNTEEVLNRHANIYMIKRCRYAVFFCETATDDVINMYGLANQFGRKTYDIDCLIMPKDNSITLY